jgi:hypothetical protein
MTIMTVAELRWSVETYSTQSKLFFTAASLRLFGDTLSNFYVSRQPVTIETSSGRHVLCWRLRRKESVDNGMQADTYFNTETFNREFPFTESD